MSIDCCICLDSESSLELWTTPCNHIMHRKCAENQYSATCPMCRRTLDIQVRNEYDLEIPSLLDAIEHGRPNFTFQELLVHAFQRFQRMSQEPRRMIENTSNINSFYGEMSRGGWSNMIGQPTEIRTEVMEIPRNRFTSFPQARNFVSPFKITSLIKSVMIQVKKVRSTETEYNYSFEQSLTNTLYKKNISTWVVRYDWTSFYGRNRIV